MDLSEFVNWRLFEIAGTSITVATLATFVLILIITFILSRVVQRAVERALRLRKVEDEGTLGVATRLVHYAVLITGLGVAVENIGIDLGTLFAAGAIFAVAIGFAMQNIAQNFVSGVILLLERAIKPGDVLSVDNEMVRVSRMGIRATIARTLDDDEVIIPNSQLVQASVRNLTLRDHQYRIRASVGVVYSSDMDQVLDVLEKAVARLPGGTTRTRVLMLGFGSSSVDFEVSVWTNDPWNARLIRSNLNKRIWDALKEAGITIAFPQLDVHLDREVSDAIVSRAS